MVTNVTYYTEHEQKIKGDEDDVKTNFRKIGNRSKRARYRLLGGWRTLA
jgi:hypothetical protein